MNATDLRSSRLATGLTQAELAKKLGRSQGYVSLLERGLRRPSVSLAKRLAGALKLPPAARPFVVGKSGLHGFDHDRAARSLAALGYPGFAYFGESSTQSNPAEVLLRTLAAPRVEPRLLEAMPWLLLRYEDLDRERTAELAHRQNLQNRLGFVVALARDVAAGKSEYAHLLPKLDKLLSSLEPVRLAREDDLGQSLSSARLRNWVRENRSEAAAHWNLLTDLRSEHLPYPG